MRANAGLPAVCGVLSHPRFEDREKPLRPAGERNWSSDAVEEIWKQAATGGVLLSSMGSPKELPVYWDRLLLNASQVTNPPIDPLREPMETRVFLGKKPERIRRDTQGRLITELTPQLELSMPVLFSAMSYGSISFNAHESLQERRRRWGICYKHRRGRPPRGPLPLWAQHHHPGGVRAVRRSRGLPDGWRGH